jgi:putative two-component system response regulator
LSHAKAVDIMLRGDGRTQPAHFDPAIVQAFEANHSLFRDIFETHVA